MTQERMNEFVLRCEENDILCDSPSIRHGLQRMRGIRSSAVNAELLTLLSPQLDKELARREVEQTVAARVK